MKNIKYFSDKLNDRIYYLIINNMDEGAVGLAVVVEKEVKKIISEVWEGGYSQGYYDGRKECELG